MITGEDLRLLVVEKNNHDAATLADVLRDAGYSIAFTQVSKTSALKSALQQRPPDIVLIGSGKTLPRPKTVQAILGQHGLSIPLIAIAGEAPEDAVVAARKAGISALVSYGRPEHLQLAFDQVVAMLRLQQRLAVLEETLHTSENRCHALVENSSDAVACFQGEMLSYANQPFMDLFTIHDFEEIGRTCLQDLISSSQHDRFEEFLGNYQAADGSDNQLQVDCCSTDGETFASLIELTPATLDGMPCTQMIIRAHDANNVLGHRIEALSQQDILTGLNNREQFMELLGDCVCGQGAGMQEAALVYILLDNFKSIREDVGIAASDVVLRDIARLIEDHAGDADHVARFGEYAFTLLHAGDSMEETRALVEELLQDIATHVSEVEGRSISTTASIGICAVTGHSKDAQSVVSRADLACEVARSSGGNQMHIHSTAVDEQLAQDQEQHRHRVIRKTIDEGRLSLVYLPIVSLKGTGGQRYEVLLRVVDDEGHAILPGEFLTIAEKTGHSGEIDRWIINAAFRTLAGRRKKGGDISFYIKLSDSTLTDAELPGWINQQLKEFRLVSDGVVFEIPERTVISDLKNSMVFIKAMQKLRCKIALEHFGRSNQPQLLKHMPADVVKIDGSLIEKLATSKEHQTRVRNIVDLARKHGKVCIAERVDNASSLALLWQYGIDFIQGNFAQQPSAELGYDFEGEIA